VNSWIVAALAVAAFVLIKRLRGGGKVSSNVVKERIEAGAVILDVRNPDEFRSGAFPGALNIPVGVLPARLQEIPRGRPVVVYCAAGVRAATAARILQQAGYADVVNAGGLRDMPR
jgi:phage shock protein E